MKNILTDHPDPEVRAAALRLLDALCMWERSTSRHNVVIVKDSIGCGYRSFDGAPVPEDVSDERLLESFQALYEEENPGERIPRSFTDRHEFADQMIAQEKTKRVVVALYFDPVFADEQERKEMLERLRAIFVEEKRVGTEVDDACPRPEHSM